MCVCELKIVWCGVCSMCMGAYVQESVWMVVCVMNEQWVW